MYVSALLVTIQEEELDLDAIAKEWLAAAPNCPLLLVTRGSQGTVAYRTGKPTISVALEPVKVVDTVRNGGAAIEKFYPLPLLIETFCLSILIHI
jgi:sugar/nucleoside kinase (ribokinase family)